jgi:hypothetical protein
MALVMSSGCPIRRARNRPAALANRVLRSAYGMRVHGGVSVRSRMTVLTRIRASSTACPAARAS